MVGSCEPCEKFRIATSLIINNWKAICGDKKKEIAVFKESLNASADVSKVEDPELKLIEAQGEIVLFRNFPETIYEHQKQFHHPL